MDGGKGKRWRKKKYRMIGKHDMANRKRLGWNILLNGKGFKKRNGWNFLALEGGGMEGRENDESKRQGW